VFFTACINQIEYMMTQNKSLVITAHINGESYSFDPTLNPGTVSVESFSIYNTFATPYAWLYRSSYMDK